MNTADGLDSTDNVHCRSLQCATCDAAVRFEEAHRTKTIGGLDPTTWQTRCCPRCGSRLKTVSVGD